MAAQPLWPAASALRLDGLEHVRHVKRGVAGARHHLGAENVRLRLVLAAVLQEIGAEPELRALGNNAPRRPADDRAEHLAGNRADLELLALGSLRRAVAESHVRDLVRHDASNLALGPGRLDHAAVQEHRAARQGERVDLLLVDHVERVPELGVTELGRDGRNQSPADPFDVIVNPLVVQQREFLADLGRGFLPELHVLRNRIFRIGRSNFRLRRGGRGQ